MRIYYFDTKKDTEGSKFEKSCKKWKKFPVMIIEHKDKVVPFSFSKRKMSNKVLTFCIDDAVSLLAKDYPELRPIGIVKSIFNSYSNYAIIQQISLKKK